MGRKQSTMGNPVNSLAAEMMYYESVDLALFFHNHRRYDTYNNYPIRVILSPGWQLRGEFPYQWTPPPCVGGTLVVCDKGRYEVSERDYSLERGKIWKIERLIR